MKLTRNQIRAPRPLTDAILHNELERLAEIRPAGLAARIQPRLVGVAEQRDSEIIYTCHQSESEIYDSHKKKGGGAMHRRGKGKEGREGGEADCFPRSSESAPWAPSRRRAQRACVAIGVRRRSVGCSRSGAVAGRWGRRRVWAIRPRRRTSGWRRCRCRWSCRSGRGRARG